MKKVEKVGIFACPAGHSASPAMHNAAFQSLALDFEYQAYEVGPEELAEAVQKLKRNKMRGVNLTIPHKVQALSFLDEISSEANYIGAVNTIVNDQGQLKGHNTDAYGFIKSLTSNYPSKSLQGLNVCLYGAGGSSRAVAVALCQKKVASLSIYNRHKEKSESLVKTLQQYFPDIAINSEDKNSLHSCVKKVTLLINTTPLGMEKYPGCVISKEWILSHHVVFDLIYNPLETELLKAAKKAGALTINGLDMLVYQGAKSFELWTGVPAPVEVMKKAALKFLKGRGKKAEGGEQTG